MASQRIDRHTWLDALEPRRHLSSATIDAGGLPRDLTQIGDVIFYLQDPKADGDRTVRDLVAFTPKDERRVSIRKPDGSRFKTTYTDLMNSSGRLFIFEPKSSGERAVWSYRVGDRRATLMAEAGLPGSPSAIVEYRSRWYTCLPDQGGSPASLWEIDPAKQTAKRVVNATSVPGAQSLTKVIVFGDRLVISATRAPDATDYRAPGKFILFSDGTRAGTHRPDVGHSVAPSTDVEAFRVGDKLVVTETDRQYGPGDISLFAAGATRGTRYRPLDDDRSLRIVSHDEFGAIITVANSKWIDGGYSQYRYEAMYTTNFTWKTTTQFKGDVFEALLTNLRFLRAGDSVFGMSDSVAEPRDPERTLFDDVLELAQNYSTTGVSHSLFRFDLAARQIQRTHYDETAASLPVSSDGLFYYRTLDLNGKNGTLWKSDGTPAGTVEVGGTFSAPFAVDGEIFYVKTGDANAFTVADRSTGLISGTVTRGDQTKKGVPLALRDVRVFVDLNRNGKRDKGEPAAVTNKHGSYALDGVPPGERRIVVKLPDGLDAIRGASRTIPVVAGRARTVSFSAVDPRRDAIPATRLLATEPIAMSRSHTASATHRHRDRREDRTLHAPYESV